MLPRSPSDQKSVGRSLVFNEFSRWSMVGFQLEYRLLPGKNGGVTDKPSPT